MKKFLLFVAAAAIAVSANAQLSNRMTAGKAQSQQKVLPAANFHKYAVKGEKKNVTLSSAGFAMRKKFQMANSQMNDFVTNAKDVTFNKTRRANELGLFYYGFGKETGVDSLSSWAMMPYTVVDSLTSEKYDFIVNLIPNILSKDPSDTSNMFFMPYTLSNDTLTIAPAYVGAMTSKNYYFFVVDMNSEDGAIRYTVDENGYLNYAIEGINNVEIGIVVFNTDTFDPEFGDTYLGYWTIFENVKYYKDGQPFAAPKVAFTPYNTVLYAGLGVTGYSYNSNLAMIGAYAPTIFQNLTSDIASAWDWSVVHMDANDNETVERSTDEHFILNTIGNDVYTNLALVGSMGDAQSDSCKWGVGKYVPDENGARYTELYAYAGATGNSFAYSDGSYAIMTTMDPDQDLTFYTNWGTPDLYDRTKMSKIFIHMGTPSSPLYFTGVTLPLVSFKDNGNFNLTAKIRKCSRTSTGRISLGDVVAEANATISDVDDQSETSGLATVNFTKFFITDEFGMTTEKDHFFMDEEFLIEIDGWNNGTFSGVIGCADIYNDNDPTTIWFEIEGEEGRYYSYTDWKTKLFVGLIDAAYGFMQTKDPSEHHFDAAGGKATMHISPMLYSVNDDQSIKTRLFTEEEIPEWIDIQITNPTSKENIDFDLTITVEALPNGVTGRFAYVNLYQEGAQLPLLIVQGDGGDLNKVAVELSKTGYATFYSYDQAYQIPEGLKAMVVSGANESGLVYTTIGNIIYQDTPVVLASTNDKTGTYKLTAVDSEEEFEGDNYLVDNYLGNLYCQYSGEDSFNFYKLTYSNDGKKFGWFWGAPNGGFFEVDDNKAMLMLDAESAGKARGFEINGAAISGVEDITAKKAVDNNYYNLQGIRMAKPQQKGLYIVNNKKVVIK